MGETVLLLWVFDFREDADEKVDFDEFSVMIMVQKGPVRLRFTVREDTAAKMGNVAKGAM